MKFVFIAVTYIMAQSVLVYLTTDHNVDFTVLTGSLAALGLLCGYLYVNRKSVRIDVNEPQSGWTEYSRLLVKKVEADRADREREVDAWMTSSRKRHKRGFTLIELLIVVGIVGVMLAGAIWGVQHALDNKPRHASPWGCQC